MSKLKKNKNRFHVDDNILVDTNERMKLQMTICLGMGKSSCKGLESK